MQVTSDRDNPYNSNKFMILTTKPREYACPVMQRYSLLFDNRNIVFTESTVSFIKPISKRSLHAKQEILFVELNMQLIHKDSYVYKEKTDNTTTQI